MKDAFTSKWITENARKVLEEYGEGITIRQLHYRLVALGMTNDIQHYKRVVNAMTKARWSGYVGMGDFIDRERSMFGSTEAEETELGEEIERGKEQVGAWMTSYHLNPWSNQPNYVEVWIEKKALQGVFEKPCEKLNVGLGPCKGYPSLTFLHEASQRINVATERGQNAVILYFGDYDPSGEDIPRSIQENLERMGCEVEVQRVALRPELIQELGLPGVPAKTTDSRSRNWNGGEVVELDAVEPKLLQEMCKTAITQHFDLDKHRELEEREKEERTEYQRSLQEFVNGLVGG